MSKDEIPIRPGAGVENASGRVVENILKIPIGEAVKCCLTARTSSTHLYVSTLFS